MSIRVTGMVSGLDTESIIQQLVAAKQTKIDTQTKAQTKLSWKQEIWSDLSTKLKNLQQKYISNMRFSTAYTKKTTTVSDSSVVSVITGDDAVEGVQSLQVNQLAKTGYLTGAKLEAEDGSTLTALSTLGDLGFTGSGSFTVNTGDTSVDIDVTESTTISDVLTKLQSAGLNASFDEGNQRLFVSSKKSGADYDFSITANDSDGLSALSSLGLLEDVSQNTDSETYKKYAEYAQYVGADDDETIANLKSAGLVDSAVAESVESYLSKYKSILSAKTSSQETIDAINEKYSSSTLSSVDEYESSLSEANAAVAELEEELENEEDEEKKAELEEKLATAKETVTELEEKLADAQTLEDETANIASYESQLEEISEYINVTTGTDEDGNTTYEVTATDKLTDEVAQEYLEKANLAYSVINGEVSSELYATKVNGQDAVITLNGAEFTSNDNTFEINGLTFTALNETEEGKSVTVTTSQDTDGIYDMIKEFLTEYNSIINEMTALYNADSASGYEPLTDDEKESMTESEIEKYEEKIKDALLRRDEDLSSITSALKSVMSSGIEVNGETLYLFDFGIETLGYFSAADNEQNAYHIDGDPDDSSTSGNSDKLKSMIASDPDTVVSFFTKLAQNLYSTMSNLSSSVDGYRTYGSFYNDKKMQSDYDDYTTKIEELEEKLADYEDKWYAKFSAMETALAKMQSNASAVTSLLGG
ncbi:MAG: flagellar filament capping protein FliD [Lachnospiraceae bacterium]|nr:flagellar filament capping protein FliD [Lachnospiraceae bacterium]